MPFEKVCSLDDVWKGDMESFETADGSEVLIVCLDGGELKAFQGICPHQQQALVEGTFENGTLTCKAHLWQFDCKTGKGVNPEDCQIAEYPVKIIGEEVHVNVFGVKPFRSHT